MVSREGPMIPEGSVLAGGAGHICSFGRLVIREDGRGRSSLQK